MDIGNPQQITLSLEVVPEDPQDADMALVSAVGRDTAEVLRNTGYTVSQSTQVNEGDFRRCRHSVAYRRVDTEGGHPG